MSVSAVNKRLRKARRERLELLTEWYGGEFAATEIAAHTSSPVPLGKGVRELLAGLETQEKRILRKLREAWPQIVVDGLAKLTEPSRWQDGVLFVEVRHSALLRELQPSLELLRQAVNAQITDVDCREIRLAISGGGRRYRKS